MNSASLVLAALSTALWMTTVYVFARHGIAPFRVWYRERSARNVALIQSWVAELSVGWGPDQSRRAAHWARIAVIVAAVMVFVLSRSALFSATAAVFVYFIPMLVYKARRERRRALMEEQIPQLVDIIVASVRAGNSLSASVEEAQDRMPSPIKDELAVINGERRGGLGIEDALGRARTRISAESFTMVASALIVSARHGGDLPHVLERISEATRELDRLRKKIKSETAEVRAQAKITVWMTPLFLVLVLFLDPSIPGILFNSFLGNALLLLVGGLQAIAIYMIRRILRSTI